MIWKKKVAVCFKNHGKHKNALCVQTALFFMLTMTHDNHRLWWSVIQNTVDTVIKFSRYKPEQAPGDPEG